MAALGARLPVAHIYGTDLHAVPELLDLGSPEKLRGGAALLAQHRPDAVVWACTSGSFVYGPAGDFHFASLTDLAAGAFQFDLQSFGQSTALFTVPTYSLFAQDQWTPVATPRLVLVPAIVPVVLASEAAAS